VGQKFGQTLRNQGSAENKNSQKNSTKTKKIILKQEEGSPSKEPSTH
jgi:hypothetical protein